MDETLKELLLGILLFGIVSLLAGVFFVESPVRYGMGLLIGLMLAMMSACHLYYSISTNLSLNADNEGGAQTYSRKQSLIRYMVILVAFGLVCITDFAYPLATFLGIMGLKAGAYLQPLIHKLVIRR